MKRASLLIALLVTAISVTPVYALVTNAPTLAVYDARAYQDVAESGDLLVLWRYGLDDDTWTTYGPEGALGTLVQGATVHQYRVPPVVGQSLGGFYLEPGHSFTWNSAAQVDLDSNPSLFTNNSTSSVGIEFVSTSFLIATSTADQDTVCTDVRELLTAVESQDADDTIDAQDYVNAGTVTTAGTSVAVTAFGAFASVLANCFSLGLDSPDGFAPDSPDGRDTLITDLESSALWSTLGNVAASLGFTGTGATATFLALVGVGFAFVVTMAAAGYAGSAAMGTGVGSVFALAYSVEAPHYLFQVMAVITVLVIAISAGYWMRSIR